ncbi:MAG TPA: cysteine--tRNA ligase [Candidatus Eisenbacteria bacterium]|nr:cysteine--tRNA ligase [Candidatus Eisenbacteria bacterium]
MDVPAPARPPLTEPQPADSARLRLAGARLPLVGRARVYVCGITPYDVTHLGHAATFVWADTAAAVMRLAGVEPETCRNVTDVDDVLTRAAAARGRYYDEFAVTQEFLFGRDMTHLRVRRPTHAPHARSHVKDVVQLGLALLANGAAYERDGHVYFRGGDLPGRHGLGRDEALALSRQYGDHPDDPLREDPFDVPVWLPSGPDDPAFPSPWGWGRPGWHAECAAMAVSLLGGCIDLLAGGADLAFPHHAYQAAMAEGATGSRPFARALLQVGTVRLRGEKMAKSTGNLVLVADLLQEAPSAAVRLLLLDRPWQAPWDYRTEDLLAAAARVERLYRAAGTTGSDRAASAAVVTALLDDLDVPTALDVAEEAGGDAARLLLRTLSLD